MDAVGTINAVAPVAPTGHDDERRRERVEAYSILETPRETGYDRFVFTAAQLFRVPLAVIAITDNERHWFKAQVGLTAGSAPRPDPLWDEIAAADAALAFEDASREARLLESPSLAILPALRFCAGAALVTPDGIRVGCLLVADLQVKTLPSRQLIQLSQLAHSITATLEARRIMT